MLVEEIKKQSRSVCVSLEFSKIIEIDTINERFNAELIQYTSWTDSESEEKFDASKHWNPELYIENELNASIISTQYLINFDESKRRKVTEVKIIRGTFWERMELHHFPLDIQELSVIFKTKKNPSEVLLLHDKKRKSRVNSEATKTFVEQQKWRLYKLVKTSENASYDGDSETDLFLSSICSQKSQKISISCYCSRQAGYYFSNAYFLIFLITIATLETFSIDHKLPQNRIQSTYTLLLSSITFKWIINRFLPTVHYLTSLDRYSIISLFYISVVCAYHAILPVLSINQRLALKIDKYAFIISIILFVLIQVYFSIWLSLAYNKIRKLVKEEKAFLKSLAEFLSIR